MKTSLPTRILYLHILFLFIFAPGWGCAEDQAMVDRGKVLNDIAKLVIIPAYEEFQESSKDLHLSIAELCGNSSSSGLLTAQTAWRAARASWKRTEGFEVGPALDLQTRNKVDKKALLSDKLEKIISGSDAIDADLVAKNSSYTRGFLALEYLLFSEQGDDDGLMSALVNDPDAGDRRCQMASAIAEYSATAAAELLAVWTAVEGAYVDIYLPAEDAEGQFASDKDGVDAVFNALLNHISDILELRLANPAGITDSEGEPDPTLISTARSGYGRQDILDNLDGVKLLLDGPDSEPATVGIGALIQARKASLYATMLAELETARAAISSIPEPLSEAISSSPDEVEIAYYALKDFHIRLGSDGATLLGISLSVNEVDND